MHITTVNLGQGEPVQIVCGAPNVAAGQKVVVATSVSYTHLDVYKRQLPYHCKIVQIPCLKILLLMEPTLS